MNFRSAYLARAVVLIGAVVAVLAGVSSAAVRREDRGGVVLRSSGASRAAGAALTPLLPAAGALRRIGGGVWPQSAGDGGRVAAPAEATDPGQWVSAGSMSTPRLWQTATLLSDGDVLVAGGIPADVGSPVPLSSAELYVPSGASGNWISTGSMALARFSATATLLENGEVLVAGGSISGSAQTATAELYDPATGTWSFTGSMVDAQVGQSATLLPDGDVFVIGGVNQQGFTAPELYDPGTGQWQILSPDPPCNGPDTSSTLTVLTTGDMLLTSYNGTPAGCSAVYVPSTDSWQSTGPMYEPDRYADGAALLKDGTVLVAGGEPGDQSPTASSETYDQTTNAWSQVGDMPEAVGALTTTRLDSGEVLAAGGVDGATDVLSSAELYDPTSETWSTAASMSVARTGDTATLLDDGSVLVTGGIDPSPSEDAWASAERFFPETIALTSPANGSYTNVSEPTFSGRAGTASGDSPSVSVGVYSGSSVSGSPVQSLTATVQSDGSYLVQASASLPDGVYTALAEQGLAGGGTAVSSANTFTIDTVAPAVTLTAPAQGSYTNQPEPTFAGQAGTEDPPDSPTVTVDLYSGPDASGAPVQTLPAAVQPDGSFSVRASSPLSDGLYTAQAEQTDLAGNAGTSLAVTFTVDTVAPAVTLSSPAQGSETNQEPTFGGQAGSENPPDASTVTVTVYSGSSVSGSPVQTLTASVASGGSFLVAAGSPLTGGTYTAQAEQSDSAGNTGVSAPDTFIVDTHLPAVTITTPASGSTDHYHSPTFSGAAGTAADDEPGIEITLYAGSSATGEPVETLSTTASGGSWSVASAALENGTYTLVAEQSDSVGTENTALSTFVLDATPPNTTISSGPPNPSEFSDATFTFFSSAENSTFQCRLDSGGWTACSSPEAFTGLPDGTHTFQVRATDQYGNTDPAGASATWTIDTSPPHTVISSSPPNPTESTTASFVFFASRSGPTFQCSLDGSDWSTCTSPATYTGISQGQHTFAVRATDATGLTDPTPATASWTVGTILIATKRIDIIAGTTAHRRIHKPTIDLHTGIASVGTAFCSAHAPHACTIALRLIAPTLTATAQAGRSAGLLLGTTHITIAPGRNAALKVRLRRTTRAALRHSHHLKAKAIFTFTGGKRISHLVHLHIAPS